MNRTNYSALGRIEALVPIGLHMAWMVFVGCSMPSAGTNKPIAPEPPIALVDGSAIVTLPQRSEATIPGSSGTVLLQIGDITRGQVVTTIAHGSAKNPLAGPSSLSVGDTLEFTLQGFGYAAALTNLSNALIGEDFATFVVRDRPSHALTEETKIRLLIASVKGMKDSVFLRNGREHNGVEAAKHLQRKWAESKGRVRTAREFIHWVGTESTTSGDPYRIRPADGREVESADYFAERLREIEAVALQPVRSKDAPRVR